jgi:hypothetical protein
MASSRGEVIGAIEEHNVDIIEQRNSGRDRAGRPTRHF